MNAAEFRCTRELLGLSPEWLANHLGVSRRSLDRWEAGVSRIPRGVAVEMITINDYTNNELSLLIRMAARKTGFEFTTYRNDEDMDADNNRSPYPASWHRALAGRLFIEMPGVKLNFYEGARS